MDYITSLETSKKWNISQRRVAILCEQKRIIGAIKVGKTWLIPSNSEKPTDKREKKYFKVELDNEIQSVAEPSSSLLVKTELMLDPNLVRVAKDYFLKEGLSLSEGINEYIKQISINKIDYSSTYPEDFFSLFGVHPYLDVLDQIDDLKAEEVEL